MISYPWVLLSLIIFLNLSCRHLRQLYRHLICHLANFTLTLLYLVYAYFTISFNVFQIIQPWNQLIGMLLIILIVMVLIYLLSPIKKIAKNDEFQLQREYVFSFGLQVFIAWLALGCGLMSGFMEQSLGCILFVICIVLAASLKELLFLIWVLRNSRFETSEDVYKL